MVGSRTKDIQKFYSLMEALEQITSGARILGNCTGRMNWPMRGVYFFRENGEIRTDSGTGMRIVRIGTHALKIDSKKNYGHGYHNTEARSAPAEETTVVQFLD